MMVIMEVGIVMGLMELLGSRDIMVGVEGVEGI